MFLLVATPLETSPITFPNGNPLGNFQFLKRLLSLGGFLDKYISSRASFK